MTESIGAELVDASRRVLDAKLLPPRGFEATPHISRWAEIHPHLERLGWFDLLDSTATGGSELSPTVATGLLRLAGSFLVPGPVIEAVLTVPWLLAQPGVSGGLLNDFRPSVAIIDPCRDLPASEGRRPIRLRDGKVQGTGRCVLGAGSMDALLIHVLDGDTERLIVIPSTHPGVHIDPLRSSDPCQSVGDVDFDCEIGDEHVIGSADQLVMARVRAWARLGSAAYLAGISERVLSFGVEHALNREQFRRRIGSFQAVQHLLADVAVSARCLANLVDFSSRELASADQHDAVIIGATAKARASTTAVLACETVLQVLGGIGFTAEHPLHHYLKRALSLTARDGSPAELYLLVGRLVLARTQEPRDKRLQEVKSAAGSNGPSSESRHGGHHAVPVP